MKVEIEIVDPGEFAGWDELVLGWENHSFFHSCAWSRAISECYGYKPKYFLLSEEGTPVACMPLMEVRSILTGNRGVSLPFTDYCQVITTQPGQFDKLLAAIIAVGHSNRWSYVELRSPVIELPAAAGCSRYITHVLDLTDNSEQTFGGFRSSVKRNIRKAKQEGVQITIGNSEEALKSYYAMHATTRKHHGVPPQPRRLFATLHRHLIAEGRGIVVLAWHHGEAIAGAVFFHFGREAVYKYGASKRSHQHLRPNNLVIWEAIKFYCSRGAKKFSFGRTDPNNAGLLQFKRGWGAKEHNFSYYRYDLAGRCFVRGHTTPLRFERALKNMPLPVLKAASALLYRHFG